MSKAEQPPTTSRRALLGGSAALAASTALPVAAAAAAHPDAALLAACDRFQRAEAEDRRLCTVQCEAERKHGHGSAEFRAAWAVYATHPEHWDAAREVCSLPATTMAGARAKAAAVWAFYQPDPPANSIMSPAAWDVICWMAGKPEGEDVR